MAVSPRDILTQPGAISANYLESCSPARLLEGLDLDGVLMYRDSARLREACSASYWTRGIRMDLFRKIGVGIVMIVPGFVFGALIYDLLQSWWAVLVLELIMIGLYGTIISGKLFSVRASSSGH